MLPCVIAFSVLCGVLSYGFKYRPAWMWYAGWIAQFIMAGWVGTFFFGALSVSETFTDLAFASIYLLGGLTIWVPCSVWWSNHRHWFGKQKSRVLLGRIGRTPLK